VFKWFGAGVTHLKDLAAVRDTGVVHAGLVHSEGDAVEQDDQDGDALEPCEGTRNGVESVAKLRGKTKKEMANKDEAKG